MLKTICTGVKLDDPYADMWLINIENEIDTSINEIKASYKEIEKALSQRSDFTHKVGQSTEPLEVPLYFSSQLAFKAAYLVNDFDSLVCAALTAKHVAAMTTNRADDYVRHAAKTVRRALGSARGYKYTGVSRADLIHKTAKTKSPIEMWGELPEAILDGSHRAPCAPPLPKASFARESNSFKDSPDK